MANKVLIQERDATDKQFIFGDHAGDFVNGAAGTSWVQSNSMDVQLQWTSVADNAGVNSAKFDTLENRVQLYMTAASIEFG